MCEILLCLGQITGTINEHELVEQGTADAAYLER